MNLFKNSRPETRSDKDLVEVFTRTRDLEILGTLYNRYMHLVYGLCLKYLKNRNDSQDAVMQIFELLITEVPKFDIANFKSWLYVVSKNYCLMKLRKDSSQIKKIENFYATEIMESEPVLHPIEETDNEQLQKNLQDCLTRLKEEQRKCVELFYYQQQCYKEIALKLEIDEMKVKSYIQNGKRNLKICLEQKGQLNEA